MQQYNIWALAVPKLEEHDMLWLKGLDVDVRLDIMTDKVYKKGYMVSERTSGYQIELTTTCTKQETMLKLKYGDKLVPKIVINSLTVPYEDLYLASHSGPST
jgi:hypothetical protein